MCLQSWLGPPLEIFVEVSRKWLETPTEMENKMLRNNSFKSFQCQGFYFNY